MTSSRLQNKITGMLSGWYSDDWNTTICWNNNNSLVIKHEELADEIIYNLKQDGFNFDSISPLDENFKNWHTEIKFK